MQRGFTIMEVVAASAMLAVLMAVIGQLVVQTKRHAGVAERRDYSLMAIENAMEELTSRDWDAVSDEAIAAYELPAGLTRRWPAAKLAGNAEEQSEPIEAKRITLELTLSDENRGRPHSLTTWIYRTPAEEAPR
jgi:prepilin-type N-terminal cleavage/methylation domain-containing protein